jgi:hypothetical protein
MAGKLKTQKCPACLGEGYTAAQRYCAGCSDRSPAFYKRCNHCKGTGIHVEHLLFTLLRLDVKPTPKIKVS